MFRTRPTPQRLSAFTSVSVTALAVTVLHSAHARAETTSEPSGASAGDSRPKAASTASSTQDPTLEQPLRVPGGEGQVELRLRPARNGLAATPCANGRCDDQRETVTEVPAEVRSETPRYRLLDIGQGRRSILVRYGDFHVLLSGPTAPSGTPLIAFANWVGRPTGIEGERVRHHLEVVPPTDRRPARVIWGDLHENLDLCGRPALLSPYMLDPASLEGRPVRLQRLPSSERREAPLVEAEALEGDVSSGISLLVVGASSAIGAPQAVSDGNPETTWAEARGGEGQGEFVLLRAPLGVNVSAFDFMFRPPSGGSERGAAPKRFWIAGMDQLIGVEVPGDGWTAGATYRVTLPKPWAASCVAIVTDTTASRERAVDVTFAEVSAVTEAGNLDVADLVDRVVGGHEPLAEAVSLLAARGAAAEPEVLAALQTAPADGRLRLLDVVDATPCTSSATAYARSLALGPEHVSERARRGLERCPREAGAALEGALDGATSGGEARLAEALARFDPTRAIVALSPLLDQQSPARRRALRRALSDGARKPTAQIAVRKALTDPNFDARIRVELLRAFRPLLPWLAPESNTAFARLNAEDLPFRERYLLLGPAATMAIPSAPPVDFTAANVLAVQPNQAAVDFLRRSIESDPEPAIRAAALTQLRAAVERDGASRPEGFEAVLLGAIDDDNVRVRRAAALASSASAQAQAALLRRLGEDEWPLVRTAAADALGNFPAAPTVDEALLEAFDDDDAITVRMRAARALGRRRALPQLESLRDALGDTDEPAPVRKAAAAALGDACDSSAEDELLAQALRLRDPHLGRDARAVAVTALRAFGRVARTQRKQRLAPLLEQEVPAAARSLAAEIAEEAPTCGSPES